jgi:MFS family permease
MISQKRALKITAIFIMKILFLYLIAAPFFLNIAEKPLNLDENSYLRSTRYFKLFFIDRDLNHPLWAHFRSYDQPPIAKYIYGFSVLVMGYAEAYPVLANLKEWVIEKDYAWNKKNGRVASGEIGYMLRYIGAVCGFAMCLLLYWIGRTVFNRRVGVLAAFLVAYNPIMVKYTKEVTSNPILNLFLLVGVVLLIKYEQAFRAQKKKQIFGYAGCLGFLVAIATATKFNGGLIFIWFVLFSIALLIELCVFRRLKKPVEWRASVRLLAGSFFIVVTIGIVCFYLPNPRLYNDPVGKTIHMLAHRFRKAAQQQQLPEQSAIVSWRKKTVFSYNRCLANDFFLRDNRPPKVPIKASLFFLGFGFLLYKEVLHIKKKQKCSARIIILIWVSATIVGTMAWLPLDWFFYYMPMIPCILIIVAYMCDVLYCCIKKEYKKA